MDEKNAGSTDKMPKNVLDIEEPQQRKMDRRTFLKIGIGGVTLVALGGGTYKYLNTVDIKGRILIIGGGAAGCSFAARLMHRLKNPDITLVDPSDRQYYQPGYTFIAAGIFKPDEVWKPQEECLPHGIKWVKDSVVELDPIAQKARTAGGKTLGYDFLVLTPGLQLDWNQIEGISPDTLGEGNAHCIYDFQGAQKTWAAVQELVKKGGRAVFTDTYTKHKCGGAPKKICLMTEHLARKNGTRGSLQFIYHCSEKALYDVPLYTPRLLDIYDERGVDLQLNHRVTGIDTQAKKVYFLDTSSDEPHPFVEDYDFLSFVPPQSAPDFVKESGLSWTEGKLAKGGWVMVDKETLIHKTYPNIVSLGDVAGIPTSKTSSAIRIQLPIAVDNLLSVMQGKEPQQKYNGYACCPVVTDYGHVLLCEFDYEKNAVHTFPFSLLDTSKEIRAGWLLKRYFLKPMFFHAMLKGWM